MKLPVLAAPVQRNFSLSGYAMSGGIKPSENLCSCSASGLGCDLKWNHCPSGYHARCSRYWLGTCVCECCQRGSTGHDINCIGPYE